MMGWRAPDKDAGIPGLLRDESIVSEDLLGQLDERRLARPDMPQRVNDRNRTNLGKRLDIRK